MQLRCKCFRSSKSKNKDEAELRDFVSKLAAAASKEENPKPCEKCAAKISKYTDGLLVVSTLIATVTFAAAFTMPGGYQGDGTDQGMATLARRASFQAFLISDTVSMICSMLATCFLVQTVALPDSRSQAAAAFFAAVAISLALYSMVVAFGTGVYVVIEHRFRWLGITVMVASCLMPVYIYLAKVVIIPSIAKIGGKFRIS